MGRYVRLPFSSRKLFLGIDRSNGHATLKPINLQIRCKMNYWSRFRSYAAKEIAVDAFRPQLVNLVCVKHGFSKIAEFIITDESYITKL